VRKVTTIAVIAQVTHRQILRSRQAEINKMSLGLLGGYVSTSDSSSDSEDEFKKRKEQSSCEKKVLSNPFLTSSQSTENKILPRPSFLVEQSDMKCELSPVENSVFNNPFRVREDQKKAMLERHVEMTTKQEDQRTIGGKKVCWNFRKGRCRFGSKCTFAHDNDVTVKQDSAKQSLASIGGEKVAKSPPFFREQADEVDDSAVIECNKKAKKRPGLSQGLVPRKKAMKFHEKVYKQNNQ